jgi:transcriptional regulator with XRE-family HTH domain
MRIDIGARLRAERKARSLSQADVERRTGLPRCRISWLENGRAIPTIETLEKLADALEIPMYRLFCDGDGPVAVVNPSRATVTIGNRRYSRKREALLLGELRQHLSRMREDDQHLLLFIAQKMAGRGLGRSPATSEGVRRDPDEAMSVSAAGKCL